MAHGTIRAATLQTIFNLIINYYSVDEDMAMKIFYESHIGACYSDDTTGLYGQSALYVFSLLLEEKESAGVI
jgi:hypothetical protein